MNLRPFFVLLPAALTLHWFWQQALGRTCAKKNQWAKDLEKGLEICSEDRFHSCSL